MAPPLIAELQRRRVFRALVGYGIAAFAVLQIIEPLMHGLHWPDAVLSYVVVALAAGFPIVVSLAWIFDVNAGRIERTPPAEGFRRRWVAPLLIGIGLLTAAPGLYYYLVVRAPRTPAVSPQASIAVLPLVNLSRDPDQEYFADGLAEELLDLLAKVPGLHVAARTSAFSFKGKNDDARTIAEKLNVATLLEGSVRKSGDQVRITTQLINAEDGYLELRAGAGLDEEIGPDFRRVLPGRTVVGLIAQEQMPQLIQRLDQHPSVSDDDWARQEGLNSFAGFPLMVETKLGDDEVGRGLRYLKARFPECAAWQISATGTKDYQTPEGIRVAPGLVLLKTLT